MKIKLPKSYKLNKFNDFLSDFDDLSKLKDLSKQFDIDFLYKITKQTELKSNSMVVIGFHIFYNFYLHKNVYLVQNNFFEEFNKIDKPKLLNFNFSNILNNSIPSACIFFPNDLVLNPLDINYIIFNFFENKDSLQSHSHMFYYMVSFNLEPQTLVGWRFVSSDGSYDPSSLNFKLQEILPVINYLVVCLHDVKFSDHIDYDFLPGFGFNIKNNNKKHNEKHQKSDKQSTFIIPRLLNPVQEKNITFYNPHKGGTHRSPREHFRKGHYRVIKCGKGRLETKVIFVSSCTINKNKSDN